MSLKIFVDADSCPVKDEIITLSRKYRGELFFVFSYAHTMSLPDDVQKIQVDNEKEAVDLYILQRARSKDICISQDHALASLLIVKGVTVLSPRGHVYKDEEMPSMLQSRYASSKARRAGQKTKGPKKFTLADRQRFKKAFESILLAHH